MIYKEELIALWGKEFFERCNTEALTLRKELWNKHTSLSIPSQFEKESEPELVLAVAIKKIMELRS